MDTHFLLAQLSRGAWHIGDHLGHVAHCLCPPLSEDHPGARLEVLGSLDEPEVAGGLIPRPQVVLVHGQDGGRLPCAAAVHYKGSFQAINVLTKARMDVQCTVYRQDVDFRSNLIGYTYFGWIYDINLTGFFIQTITRYAVCTIVV